METIEWGAKFALQKLFHSCNCKFKSLFKFKWLHKIAQKDGNIIVIDYQLPED